jgi:hypothetical protein
MLEGQGIEPGSLASLGRQPKVGQGSTQEIPEDRGEDGCYVILLAPSLMGLGDRQARISRMNGWSHSPDLQLCLPLGMCTHYEYKGCSQQQRTRNRSIDGNQLKGCECEGGRARLGV